MSAIPRHAYAAMIDAVECAVIDKGASKATRQAAFSALLALVDAGLGHVDEFASGDGNGPAPAHAKTGLRLMG
jgi:hypothetical protein